jgi:hypothetical protein
LYTSDIIATAHHSIEIRKKDTKPIAIHAIYHVDNGQTGLYELERTSYEVNSGDNLTVKIKRLGGDHGRVSVLLETWAETATAGTHYKDMELPVEFANKELERTVTIETHRFTGTAPLTFLLRLCDPLHLRGDEEPVEEVGGAGVLPARWPTGPLIGWNHSATVVIKGHESLLTGISKDKTAIIAIACGCCLVVGIALVVTVVVRRRKQEFEVLTMVSSESLVK